MRHPSLPSSTRLARLAPAGALALSLAFAGGCASEAEAETTDGDAVAAQGGERPAGCQGCQGCQGGDGCQARHGHRGGPGHGGPGHRGPGHDGPPLQELMFTLDLTDAQRAEVDEILAQHRARTADDRRAMRAERRETRDALLAVLTPAQRARLDTMRAERRAAHVDGRLAHMKAALELTDAQAQQIRGLMLAAHERRDAIRDDDTLEPPARRAAMEAVRDETHASIEGLLTPEQQTKFRELRARMHERGGRHGRGPGGGSGGR